MYTSGSTFDPAASMGRKLKQQTNIANLFYIIHK